MILSFQLDRGGLIDVGGTSRGRPEVVQGPVVQRFSQAVLIGSINLEIHRSRSGCPLQLNSRRPPDDLPTIPQTGEDSINQGSIADVLLADILVLEF